MHVHRFQRAAWWTGKASPRHAELLTPTNTCAQADIWYAPFFSVFGESFLDDLAAETNCIGPFPFRSCGASNHWIIPLLTGLYMVRVRVRVRACVLRG